MPNLVTFPSLFISLLDNSSSSFHERSRNEVSLLLFRTSTQANFFFALQHFLLFDWSQSSMVFTGPIFFAGPPTLSTGHQNFATPQPAGLHCFNCLQHFATLHCFNWSSTLRHSTTHWFSLLQLVFSSLD